MQPHRAKALQGQSLHAQAAATGQPRDSIWVRAASSVGASAAAGMVTAATFPAASVLLPISIAALGGVLVAMIGRHQVV